VRNDSPVQSYLDLAGKPVGAVKGSTSADNIARVAPSARLQLFPSHSAQLAALRAGQLDAITGDSVILKSLAAEAPGLRLAGEAFSYEPYGIAVGQGESALRDAINEILQQLWEDGRYRSIYDTWFGPRTPYAGLALPALRPFPP
jgi:ABC-type amino acid transport substrate-binding protein